MAAMILFLPQWVVLVARWSGAGRCSSAGCLRRRSKASGHVRYRSSCRYCVLVCGIGHQHRSSVKDGETTPTVCCDSACMSDHGSPDSGGSRPYNRGTHITTSIQTTDVDHNAVHIFIGFLSEFGWMRYISWSEGDDFLVSFKFLCVSQCQSWI